MIDGGDDNPGGESFLGRFAGGRSVSFFAISRGSQKYPTDRRECIHPRQNLHTITIHVLLHCGYRLDGCELLVAHAVASLDVLDPGLVS